MSKQSFAKVAPPSSEPAQAEHKLTSARKQQICLLEDMAANIFGNLFHKWTDFVHDIVTVESRYNQKTGKFSVHFWPMAYDAEKEKLSGMPDIASNDALQKFCDSMQASAVRTRDSKAGNNLDDEFDIIITRDGILCPEYILETRTPTDMIDLAYNFMLDNGYSCLDDGRKLIPNTSYNDWTARDQIADLKQQAIAHARARSTVQSTEAQAIEFLLHFTPMDMYGSADEAIVSSIHAIQKLGVLHFSLNAAAAVARHIDNPDHKGPVLRTAGLLPH